MVPPGAMATDSASRLLSTPRAQHLARQFPRGNTSARGCFSCLHRTILFHTESVGFSGITKSCKNLSA